MTQGLFVAWRNKKSVLYTIKNMNSITTISRADIRRSKSNNEPFVGAEKHGSVGWLSTTPTEGTGEVWHELRCWRKEGYEFGWISVEEFVERKNKIKNANRTFYATHPNELRGKIDLKRGRIGGSRRVSQWDVFFFASPGC
ncbi:MAG: hypothetical protein RIT04_273 [Candidatus Parcubacteria bacterium]|jgi:hypothetical protein